MASSKEQAQQFWLQALKDTAQAHGLPERISKEYRVHVANRLNTLGLLPKIEISDADDSTSGFSQTMRRNLTKFSVEV